MICISYNGSSPRVADSALIAETAYLIGDVEIGENSSVWPGVVIRADFQPIKIGNNCHIEDNTTVHGTVTMGDNSLIGHNCVIEGKVGSNTMVGSHSYICPRAEVGNSCLVAANSVILEEVKIPDRSFVVGTPAVIKGELSAHNAQRIKQYAAPYVDLVKEYQRQGIWQRPSSGGPR